MVMWRCGGIKSASGGINYNYIRNVNAISSRNANPNANYHRYYAPGYDRLVTGAGRSSMGFVS